MFKWFKLFFSHKKNELEEDLVANTMLMLGLLTDLKKKGKITKAVYNSEIQKKINFLKSLNKSYEHILNENEKEAAVTDERDDN